jgi:iron complex outermembrane recepter protein
MSKKIIEKAGAMLVVLPLSSPLVFADHVEEVVVSGRHDTRTIDITEALIASPDITELLAQAPGANINRNGPVTGIPQYRGMYGSRIAVSMNGNQLAPAGPNWMDPPLSYAITAQLESLEVYRGIAPVSVAQESIGGAVDAKIRRRDFGDSEEFGFEGRMSASAQSVNEGYQLDTGLQASNQHHRIRLAAMVQEGDDAEFKEGDILPSEYERERYDIGYGLQFGNHTFQLDYGYNDTGVSGTPALPMDIDYIEGDLIDINYSYHPADGVRIEAALFGSELDHGMTNYHLRQAPPASNWRRNIADSSNRGFRLNAVHQNEYGTWRAGIDGFSEEHDSDIDNPNNPMFFVTNFNTAEREILGAFIEHERDLGDKWQAEFGLRYNRIESDAGEVNGMPAMTMAPAQQLRDEFNQADREQNDSNLDLVAKTTFEASDNLNLYLGVAQKNRSPSYQERYLWLPLEATAGLADGQLYIGNIELDSERSHIVEMGLDFQGEQLTLSPRIFYNRVDDYIQGTPLGAMHPATRMVRMMNNMNGTNRPDPLQFNNVDAELYGIDLDWALELDHHWSLSGLVNYVRGERRDIDDDLYRIAPLNGTFRLHYNSSSWNATLETVLYADQDDVSETNREKDSDSYGIVNLKGSWQATPQLLLAAGVENLFDEEYESHLSGYNRASNPDIATGERLPGYGANVFGRLVYTF